MIRRVFAWRGLQLLWPAALAVVLAVAILRPWELVSGAPMVYWGDALAVSAHFKTVAEQGWYEYQPRLGAPFGQSYHDFPTADNLHMVAALLLSWVTPSWGVAVNTYFILGFALAALTAAWFFRVVGLSSGLGGVLAVLYSLAPAHFLRGIGHLWLSSYYAVPLGLALIVLMARGERVWGWSARRGPGKYLLSRTAGTIAITGLVAASSTYYGVFFLVILASVGILTWLVRRSWKELWLAAAVGVTTVAWLLLNMLPDILYSRAHGANPDGLDRSRGEAEVYALKFVQMILPSGFHRIDALAQARRDYDSHYIVLGEPSALGATAALGFVASFVIVLAVALSTRSVADANSRTSPRYMIQVLSVLTVVAFMFATVGGISTLISFLTPNLRGWNRITVFLAATSLGVTGLLLEYAWRKFVSWRAAKGFTPGSAPRRLAAIGALGVILAAGTFDQTPAIPSGSYSSTNASFTADKEYFTALEASLPAKAQVFVVPSLAFPETTSPSGWFASQQLIPYLQTKELRFSVAGIKGRPEADWPRSASQYGDDELAFLAAAAGMQGVLVDRNAYLDKGLAVETELAKATGSTPVVDSQGRYAYYSLDAVVRELAEGLSASERDALKFDITEPVVPYLVEGSTPYWVDDVKTMLPLGDFQAIELVNAGDEQRDIHVSFSAVAEAADVELVVSGCGADQSIALGTERGPVTIAFEVPQAGCTLSLAPSRAAAISLTVPTVQDESVLGAFQKVSGAKG